MIPEKHGIEQIGRPHIARLMIAKGIVKTIDEAFDQYLGKNAPAYVDKYRIKAATAIELILKAGGVPVLAHPGILETNENQVDVEELVVSLKE